MPTTQTVKETGAFSGMLIALEDQGYVYLYIRWKPSVEAPVNAFFSHRLPRSQASSACGHRGCYGGRIRILLVSEGQKRPVIPHRERHTAWR